MSILQVTPPLGVRAQAVKAELSDTEGLKYKIEEKNNEIIELKKNIKMKSQEVGEVNVKVGLLEKKLEIADTEVFHVTVMWFIFSFCAVCS